MNTHTYECAYLSGFVKKILTRDIHGDKYDIGWEYDVYSLKPLVTWAEGPSTPMREQALKSVQSGAFKSFD